MSPKTTSSADELTLFLTHGSGFADNLDWPYSTSRAIPPSIGLPPAKPRVRKIVSVRRLVLAGLAVLLLLTVVSGPKVATQNYKANISATGRMKFTHRSHHAPRDEAHHAERDDYVNSCRSPYTAPRLETFGTRVDFVASPQDACRQAADMGKLAFILHVSGYFEDPGFT